MIYADPLAHIKNSVNAFFPCWTALKIKREVPPIKSRSLKVIAVESRPQKGTLRIQQLAQPHQLENQLRHAWRQLTREFTVRRMIRRGMGNLPLPPVVSYETHSLINGSLGRCQCSDWYQNRKAGSVNGSHRLHSAASAVQVTYSWLAAVQLPWNSDYLCTEHLINLIKGRRVCSEDSWGDGMNENTLWWWMIRATDTFQIGSGEGSELPERQREGMIWNTIPEW